MQKKQQSRVITKGTLQKTSSMKHAIEIGPQNVKQQTQWNQTNVKLLLLKQRIKIYVN